MSINNKLDDDANKFSETIRRIQRAYERFARKTEYERRIILTDFPKYMEQADEDGLAFLLTSNNSVASNNELHFLLNLTPTEAMLVAGASQNLATGNAIDAGLPPLSDKIKLLAQQHVISVQINDLLESPHSADMNYTYDVDNGKIINVVKVEPAPPEDDVDDPEGETEDPEV